jgi:hypothetical protein
VSLWLLDVLAGDLRMVPQFFSESYHVKILGFTVGGVEFVEEVFKSNQNLVFGQWEELISESSKVLSEHITLSNINWSNKWIFLFVDITHLL